METPRYDPAIVAGLAGIVLTFLAALLVPVRGVVDSSNVALVLVLAVVVAGGLGGRAAGLFAATAAVLGFGFFHTEPYLMLAIRSHDDVITAVLVLLIGLAAGGVDRAAPPDAGSGRQWSGMTAPTPPSRFDGSRIRRRRTTLGRRRQLAGLAIAGIGAPVLTLVLTHLRDTVHQPSVLLLFVLVVVAAAAVGGVGPGLAAALGAFLLVNWYFTPPIHTWVIAGEENVIALVVFLVVAGTVSWYVAIVARRSAEATQAREEAETLARAAAGTVADDAVPLLLGHLRDAFALDGAAILVRAGSRWRAETAVGDAPTRPEDAAAALPLGDDGILALGGPPLGPQDRRVLEAFASQLAAALQARRLRAEAAEAARLAEVNELRTALLAAVSHDLRTPLASIKAAVTSLLADDVEWEPAVAREFSQSINDEADRLNTLVGNLLDMSRITTGAVDVLIRPVGMDEVVAAALASLGERVDGRVLEVEVPETLPRVQADPALLERAVANLVDNAVSWSPEGVPVRVCAGARDGCIELRITDRGPGIPLPQRERVFQPFQRLGDSSRGGVGLGLAVARGFVEVLHGSLSIEDTPGGGLTMVVSLPAAGAGRIAGVPAG